MASQYFTGSRLQTHRTKSHPGTQTELHRILNRKHDLTNRFDTFCQNTPVDRRQHVPHPLKPLFHESASAGTSASCSSLCFEFATIVASSVHLRSVKLTGLAFSVNATSRNLNPAECSSPQCCRRWFHARLLFSHPCFLYVWTPYGRTATCHRPDPFRT